MDLVFILYFALLAFVLLFFPFDWRFPKTKSELQDRESLEEVERSLKLEKEEFRKTRLEDVHRSIREQKEKVISESEDFILTIGTISKDLFYLSEYVLDDDITDEVAFTPDNLALINAYVRRQLEED